MAKQHVYDLNQVFDTIQLGDEEFRINMSDASIRDFRGKIYEYGIKFEEIQKIDAEKATPEEADALLDQSRELLREVIDGILGAGSFKKIYKTLGESVSNAADFTVYLFDLIETKYKEQKEKQDKKRAEYTRTKKKAEAEVAAQQKKAVKKGKKPKAKPADDEPANKAETE